MFTVEHAPAANGPWTLDIREEPLSRVRAEHLACQWSRRDGLLYRVVGPEQRQVSVWQYGVHAPTERIPDLPEIREVSFDASRGHP